MDYNRLENLRKLKKFSQEELAQRIGLTKNGYQTALKKDTLKVKDLEKISTVLQVSTTFFFIENSANEVNEQKPAYGIKCKNCERLENIIDNQILLIKELEQKFNIEQKKKVS